MSILQFSPVKSGQSGVKPATYKMVSTNTLSQITTAGFLKQGTGGQFLERNDIIEVIASYGTTAVENANLYVTIDANGVITLNVDLPEGLGQAALKNVTDNSKPLVASVTGTMTVGHLASFADTAGTSQDSGIAATNVQLKSNLIARQASVGGTGTTYSITVAESTLTSIVTGTLASAGLAAASVVLLGAGNGSIQVQFSADPGAGSLFNYFLTRTSQ